MRNRNIFVLIITSIIILLPIAAGVLLWEQLPAQLPIHWGLSGGVDGYAPKAVAVVAFPLLMLALQWLPKPKKNSKQCYEWLLPIITVLLFAGLYYYWLA